MHEATVAKFLVNGEISDGYPVRSGIRQGCPLVPLLFILAVEPLGLALNEYIKLKGSRLPGSIKAHKFSAFADDATVFLSRTKNLKFVLKLLDKFGEISGFCVQPAKSQYIFLNKSIKKISIQGIPVLRTGELTR